MELEQRVKSLEYEIKIVKNEIQRTLLEIQEQILLHYYPDLRSLDASITEGVVQSFEAIQQKKAGLVENAPPLVKAVSLDQARVLRQASTPPQEL